MEILFCSPDGDKGQTLEEPSPAPAPVVRPKERPGVCADPRRRNQPLQDWDVEPGHRAGVSPPQCPLSNTERRGRDRQRKGSMHRRSPQLGRTGSPQVTGAGTLKVLEEEPGGPPLAEDRRDAHALEVTQHFFEAVSTQLERWYERKVDEARLEAAERRRAERAALVERIAHLEDELRLLRTSRQDQP